MEHWNIGEVCEFLSKNGLKEDIVEAFRVNKITGSVLLLLSDDDLRELGLSSPIQKHFHRVLLKTQEEMNEVRYPVHTWVQTMDVAIRCSKLDLSNFLTK